jgi:hypothetical protein
VDAEDAREMYCWKYKRFLDFLNLRWKWTSGGEWVFREQD